MTRWIFVFSIGAVAAGLTFGALHAQEKADTAEPTTVTVPLIAGKVVVDGKASELQWRNAATVDRFVPFRQWDKQPDVKTEVRLFTDGTMLYASYRCIDGGAAARRAAAMKELKPGDAPPAELGYDDVELFVDPQLGFPALMQARVNSDMLLLQEAKLRGHDLGNRDIPMQAAVTCDETSWTVEIALPLDDMGLLGRWLEGPETGGIKVFFARNYRIPAVGDAPARRGAAVSGVRGAPGQHWGFHDSRFFYPARFDARGPVRVRLGLDQVSEGWLFAGVEFDRGARHRFALSWPIVAADTVRDGRLVDLAEPMTIEADRSTGAMVMHQSPGLVAGRFVVPVSLAVDRRLVYRRPVLMELEGVSFWPNFPMVSQGEGRREVELRVPDYLVGAARPAGAVRIAGPDGAAVAELPIKVVEANRRYAVRGFEEAFRKLGDGSYVVQARMAAAPEHGPTPVVSMSFVKGDPTLPEDIAIPNPGFEEARTQGKPPHYWVDGDRPELKGKYPAVWGVAKQASVYEWADPAKTPQAVYAGRRSVHLVSFGIGAQLHFTSGWFTIDRDKLYKLTLAGRGRGRFVVRYYVQNDKGEWMNNYFQCEPMDLGRDWKLYTIPPVDFRVKVDKGWSGQPLKAGHDPVRAKLVVWPLNDAEMWVDSVGLRPTERKD